MPKIRVLVVDDSVAVRRVLTEVLSEDGDIEVAGVVANGRIALQRIPELVPDLVTMAVEMPEMDGLSTLTAIRAEYPRLPVIMYGPVTERAVLVTFDPLGVTEWVTEPDAGGMAGARQHVIGELIPKIKALGGARARAARIGGSLPAGIAGRTRRTPGTSLIELIAIGCSTGGPNALTELFRRLPASLPVPIIVTQHMPPVFTRYLAERLDGVSELVVAEATPGTALRPGFAWIAPGDHHLTVEDRDGRLVLDLNRNPPEHSCRPAVDPMFRSAAKATLGRVLGVVLTGMGQDGALGARKIKEAGGHVIVQDEPTSVVWGMPGTVVESGHADHILPLADLPKEILRRASVGRTWSPPPLAATRG